MATTPSLTSALEKCRNTESHRSKLEASRIDFPENERARQLADIAKSGDEDNAECAAADLAREFPAPGI